MRKLTVFICTGLISSLPQDSTAIVNFSTEGGGAIACVDVGVAAVATVVSISTGVAHAPQKMTHMRIDHRRLNSRIVTPPLFPCRYAESRQGTDDMPPAGQVPLP